MPRSAPLCTLISSNSCGLSSKIMLRSSGIRGTYRGISRVEIETPPDAEYARFGDRILRGLQGSKSGVDSKLVKNSPHRTSTAHEKSRGSEREREDQGLLRGSLEPSDLIFALAGRQARKTYALRLWREGFGKHILLSTGRFEIRRFAELDLPVWPELWEMRSRTAPKLRHFFVSFDSGAWEVELIPTGHFGTLREIRALKRWLQAHPENRSLLVVSDRSHLYRVRMCCRKVLGSEFALRLVAPPDEEKPGEQRWRTVVPWIYEWIKVPVYLILLAIENKAQARRQG